MDGHAQPEPGALTGRAPTRKHRTMAVGAGERRAAVAAKPVDYYMLSQQLDL
jgi:hypothetical protein